MPSEGFLTRTLVLFVLPDTTLRDPCPTKSVAMEESHEINGMIKL